MKKWVVFANRVEAIFFKWNRATKSLGEVGRMKNPAGRLRNSALKSDKPGRSLRSPRSNRSAYSPRSSAKECELQKFARAIAGRLERASYRKDFDHLTLVAEPHMLGVLRKALKPQAAAHIVGSVSHELHEAETAEFEKYLIDQRIY